MKKNCALLVFALFVASAEGCRPRTAPPPGYQGVVELDERVVSFEVAGRVVAVPVQRGDAVEPGKVLAKLDDALQSFVRDARAEEVSAAKADLALLEAGARVEDVGALAAKVRAARDAEAFAKTTLDRTKGLVDKGSLPQSELDRARTEWQRASAELRSVEQQLKGLKSGARPQEILRAKSRVAAASATAALESEKLARHVLVAKEPGIVLDVLVDPGELAGAGTPAVTVADPTHPYVDVFVPEGELPGIRVGAKAAVRTDGNAAPLAGAVEWISPKTEFTPRFLFSERERPNLVVRVRVRVNDPGRVLPAGMPAFVSIER